MLPDCGSLLSRLCDYPIHCHISLSISVAAPTQSLVTGVEEHTGRLLVVVISSHQKSTMVHHCDTIATIECLSPRHTTITRYVQVRIFAELRANGPMSYDNSRGRILQTIVSRAYIAWMRVQNITEARPVTVFVQLVHTSYLDTHQVIY